jgi:hypothetical protein
MALLLLVLVPLPMAAILALIESGVDIDPVNMLVLGLALGLGFLAPVSRAGAYFLVLHDLRALNDFCSQIQKGRYGARFAVGIEGDDEHEMLRLKRNMNWMAHHIESQTKSLHERLDESDLRKRFYEEMSYRDSLTGLYNRRYFDRFLPDALRDPARGAGVFLALIDCDGFKQVNDTLGHQAGDEVLATLGRIIAQSNFRPAAKRASESAPALQRTTTQAALSPLACARGLPRVDQAWPSWCIIATVASTGLRAWEEIRFLRKWPARFRAAVWRPPVSRAVQSICSGPAGHQSIFLM